MMKTINSYFALVVLTALLLSHTPATAQDGPVKKDKKETSEKRFQEFSQKLNLSSDQQQKLKNILVSNREQMKSAKANTNKTERKKSMLEVRKNTDSQINAILNDKQQALYREHKEVQKAEVKRKMAERKKHERKQREDSGDEGIF